ncbi:phage portal protein family protein [Geminisphaera colitermitum]|uniref:phage portal protein family protein n=1 Tax=Geminisphaera colitermitum TaxID=1148786 RepID=UPI0001965560|nr:DUF935 family protein [Geminisphaera colitermitum]
MNRHALEIFNAWRAQFNPLRGLTIARGVNHLEEGMRGMFADLQWLYRAVERRDATLRGLKRLRLAAIGKLDWNIKTSEDSPAARAQAATLTAAYDAIDNLTAAIRFLSLAEFRGFAHLEKVYRGDNPANPVIHLEPVPQWFWVRAHDSAPWEYNVSSNMVNRGRPIDPAHFIIREVEDPINEVALIAYIRKLLSQKNWDGFVEIFGIPSVFVVMPPNIPSEEVDKYIAMAKAVIADTRGVLPNGASVTTLEAAGAGGMTFKEHLDYQDAQIVLAGTSGKLTMLTESGSGTLAGGAHQDTFDTLAEAEAAEISECFQKQFDKPLLARAHPSEPVLAYFELAAETREDTKAILADVLNITQAGGAVDWAQISEKTGYTIQAPSSQLPAPPPPPPAENAPQAPETPPTAPTPAPAPEPAKMSPQDARKPAPAAEPQPPAPVVAPDALLDAIRETLAGRIDAANAEDFAPALDRLDAIAAAGSDDEASALIRAWLDDFPAFARQVLANDNAAEALAKAAEEAAAS